MRRVLTALFVTAGLLAFCAADAAAWWNKSWSHRRKLTFDNSIQPENLTGFQVLVVLNSTRIDYAKTRSDGYDLRFVDSNDSTLLDYEIEKWDELGTSYVWVRIPQVDASSSTDFIWMYYGNPSAPNVQSAAAVWAGYSMVQHLEEPFPSQHLDSTGNANNSSMIDVQTQASPLGKIDGADLFSSASADNVDVPDAATLDKGAGEYLLVEAWINTGNSGGQMIVSKENVGTGTEGEIQLWTTGGNASFWLHDGTAYSRAYGTTNVADGAWHYVVGRWYQATSTTEVFVDGLSEGSDSDVLGEVSTTTPLVIGQEGDADRGFDFDGRIDEVRVTKALRSNNWIRAQYLSMSDIGAGLVGPFVTFGAEAAHCCDLQVSETATDVTVTAPNRFRAVYATTAGGSMERFYDLEEDPAASLDLAGALIGSASPWGLHNTGINVSGTYYNTGINTNGPKLDLLEVTPARVKLRQESFYQSNTGVVLGSLKAVADHTLYGIGRTAVHWNRRATGAVTYAAEFQETMIHRLASGPLSGWTVYFQAAGAAAGTGGDDFSLTRNESAGTPGVRTDFLNIQYKDWTVANGHLATANLTDRGPSDAQERINAYWDDTAGATIPAGTGAHSVQAGESWDFLAYFKPTTLVDHSDAAVTSRSADYRTPSGITVSVGAQWQAADENTSTGGDFFNEAEGAYAFDLDPASGLTFAMDGSVTTRHYPFFKIRRWQSFIETPAVTFDPDGAGAATPTAVVNNTGYRAAVKPVARAHFAEGRLWYSTLQDSASVTSPFVGNGTGTTQTGMSYADGRYGQGAVFNSVSDEIAVVVQPGAGLANIEFDRGRIEFWYKPNNAHTDNAQHYLFDIDSDNVDYNSTRIRIKKESNTSCGGCENGLTAEVTDATGFARGITILYTNYSWRAGDWVHLALEWDSFDATDNIRAYMNGIQLVPVAVANGVFTMNAETASGVIRIGNKAVSPGSWSADGIIDEFKIYSAPLADIGHGGLASDSREYLASSSSNFSLALQPVDASARGPYLFFGFDSKPKGLNVSLATPGAGVTDNQVQWYFWNGTTWGTASPTDGTNSFKKTGTISWGTDWAGWSPYSMNGGPDLYYMMARLGGVSGYTTTPVERQIKTDILLFQYCNDVTTAAATFTFGVPAPTAVGLMSFAAVPGDGAVTLEWQTGSELDNLGFHLYRGPSGDGPWTRLTSSLIPGLGSSPLGQAYSWLDTGLTNGVRYYYRLEDVDTASVSTFHGPVSAVPGSVSSPPGEGGEGGGGGDDAERGDGEPAPGSCPTWILAAAPDAVSPVCTKHGNPDATSLQVLARGASSATVELRTGGFWVLRDAAGEVHVFVPGLEFPTDAKAPALPLRRALVEAVIGKQVHLVSAEALELQSFPGLRPSAVGQAEMSVSRNGTVRPTRRSLPARFLSGGLMPQQVARLVGTVFQGERKSAVVEMTPVRFDGSGQKLVLAGRVRVKLRSRRWRRGRVGRGAGGGRCRGGVSCGKFWRSCTRRGGVFTQ